MVIDKIGNINNIIEPQKSKQVAKNAKVNAPSDSINISNEAKIAAEEARYTQIIKETPDIRAEKVEQIKAQMMNGTYDKHLDDKVIELVANKLTNQLIK